jgi:hypothetical protein
MYNELFTPEKLHIQTDRSMYAKGETVFYKAYVFANGYPSGLSKTLYTDWYDANGKLVQQTEAPLLLSVAKGSFDIPANYSGTTLHMNTRQRTSLYWNPFVITDKTNQKITLSFYNNDISKKLCLILEGVNEDGKLTRVIKWLE